MLPATLFLIAALTVAVVRTFTYFDNGIWLVAYLLLVGFLAQYLLGEVQSEVTGGPDGGGPTEGERGSMVPPEIVRLESLLWNAGSVLVPLSVMAGGKAGVIVGSIGLALALVLFGRVAFPGTTTIPGTAGHGSGRNGGNGMLLVYRLLILFMAVSVITGIVLAWGRPWF